VKTYTNEMRRLILSVPEEKRILLPDHVVSNQEIDVFITKETGVAVDYIGLNRNQKITVKYSDCCYDDLIFPPTENPIPCNQGGALKLVPLAKSADDEPIKTITLQGDFNGITLFKIEGAGHFFPYDKVLMAEHFGRHVFFQSLRSKEILRRKHSV